MKCDGMRKDGTCGNGYNADTHNKKCIGPKNCPEAFTYKGGDFNAEADEQVQSALVMGYKDRVSEQYRAVCQKTGEFFREVVKFGALLNEVESFIGEARGRAHDGDGLKGWLEENCPDVNHNTAKGYKAMAAKCAKMIGGGVQAIACLQGRDEIIEPASRQTVEVDSAFIEKRDALFEQVDSRRQLEQMWFQFMGQKKPGRPAGTVVEYKRKSSLECAVEATWPTVQHLLKHRGEMFTAYKLLPDEKLIEMRQTFEEHVAAIAAELKRRG